MLAVLSATPVGSAPCATTEIAPSAVIVGSGTSPARYPAWEKSGSRAGGPPSPTSREKPGAQSAG